MAATNYTPISLYYSTTASTAPTAGNLVNGELAINITDGVLYYKDNAGAVQKLATKGGVGTSSTTQVLYNSSGLVVGSANLTFNGTTLTTANDASISGLTVGRGGGAVAGNVALGDNAGLGNTTGGANTFIGSAAGKATTSANNNTALGYAALFSNTTGASNTAIGSGINGTANGALGSNTTGGSNTAVGVQSLFSNTTASNNTAVGYQALYSSNGATNTVAFGGQAGYNLTTGGGGGGYSVYIGYQAGYNVTTNSYNCMVGAGAGYNSTGGANTFVGGSSNTGWGAGYSMTTGSSNTILGGFSGNQGGLDIRTASNYIVLSDGSGNPRAIWDNNGKLSVGGTGNFGTIGAIQSAAGSYCMGTSAFVNGGTYYHMNFLEGSTGRGSITSNGSVTLYNTTSDQRLKENIVDAGSGLEKLANVKIRAFDWIENKAHTDFGVIAQELQIVAPEAVSKGETEEDMMSVDTSALVPAMIKAIQELNAKVTALEAQLSKP
jgi:hypothetical protein